MLNKKHYILISFIIVISLIFFFRVFSSSSLKDYRVLSNYLQTQVVSYLLEKGEIYPIKSIEKIQNKKIWQQVHFELYLSYKENLENILNDIKNIFNLTPELIQENKEFSKYFFYYKDKPFQVFKIYKDYPKVGIIFDDIGENLSKMRQIISLDVPLTVSILPFLSYSQECAFLAKENNIEVMLHLPLEPHGEKVTPEEKTINTNMSEDEIIKLTNIFIENVPFIKGVNNHMGSKATEDHRVMNIILNLIKEKNLYFVDSKTSSKSVAYDLAKKLGIPADINRCYLDNINNPEYISKRFDLLINLAKKRGEVIAIGHPRENTINMLKKYIPKFQENGIKFVYISEIIKK